MIVVVQGESRDAREQECKSAGRQEKKECKSAGMQRHREARVKELKSA